MTVTINGTSGVTFPDSSTQAVGFYGFKNRIINGAMMIDQRNAGASTTPTDYSYSLDRWESSVSQASKFTIQQTPSATETGYATRVAAGFTNYLAATSSSAYSVGAGDIFRIFQNIEGFNTADLAWGTSSAKTVTLSFWVYSSLTGTFGGSINNSAQNRSYPFSYVINSANTWEQKSVTIAGDTGGTWVGATNGVGIRVSWSIGAGSSYSGTAGAWVGSTIYSVTGATSVVGTSSATFYITGVQLEKGSTATSFDYRPYGTELMLCQRYYWKNQATTLYTYFGSAIFESTTLGDVIVNFPVSMRTVPTMTLSNTATYDGVAVNAITGTTGTVNASTNTFGMTVTLTSTATPGRGGGFIANNNSAAYVAFSAEL